MIDVEAIDDDQGRNGEIIYGFYDNNFFVNETEEFTINSVTGVISAKKVFDREEQSSYTVSLIWLTKRNESIFPFKRYN